MVEKKRVIPNTFIIGLMKTGTTSLYYYFKKHPQIFVPDIRDPSYLAKKLFMEKVKDKPETFVKKHYSMTIDDYLDLYKHAKERVIIDMSPIYLYSKEAAQNIYNLNPNAKILLFLREPVSWLHSLHACNVFDLQEPEKDFKKAIGLESERMENKKNRFLYYSDRTRYAEGLKRYLKVFPPEQIKIMFYEKRKANKEKYLNEILDFLGADNIPNLKPEVVNVNKEARFGGAIKKLFRIPLLYTMITEVLPNKRNSILNPIYERVAYKKTSRKPIDDGFREELKNRYKSNVVDTEKVLKKYKLIDEDFSLIDFWNYS